MSCISPERDDLVVWETPKNCKKQRQHHHQRSSAHTLYMPSMYSESDDEMEDDWRCEAGASQTRHKKEMGSGASRYALRRSLAWSFSEQDEQQRCPTETTDMDDSTTASSKRAYTEIVSNALMTTHNCAGEVLNNVANRFLHYDDHDNDAADAMKIARVTPVHWLSQVKSTANIRQIFHDQLKREGIVAFQE